MFCSSAELASLREQGWGLLESPSSLAFQQGAFSPHHRALECPGGLVWDGRCWERQGEARGCCPFVRVWACLFVRVWAGERCEVWGGSWLRGWWKGALGWVHWQLEEVLQVDREVGRGGGAPCQPAWHSQDRGLPTVPSATLLFLRLRFQAGFVEVTWGWPQVPGMLPWSRGEADSLPAAPSYSGGWEEHVLERFLQGGTVYMRRMAGPGLGQSPSGGKQTFQEACLNVQPAQLLRGLCFSDV